MPRRKLNKYGRPIKIITRKNGKICFENQYKKDIKCIGRKIFIFKENKTIVITKTLQFKNINDPELEIRDVIKEKEQCKDKLMLDTQKQITDKLKLEELNKFAQEIGLDVQFSVYV